MFYSHELLGRKTPLGAIWILAHGRKLSKGKIMSINLRQICDQILQPDVPHSLRLQGILVGGLVIVYDKQQTYLLEDLQEMMKRVRAAGKTTGTEEGVGGAAASRTTLKRDRNQAKLDVITLMDMEDLLAPAGADEWGDSLSDLLGGPLASNSQRTHSRGDNQLTLMDQDIGDGFFVMPSMPSLSDTLGTTLTAATEDQEGSRLRSRGTKATAGSRGGQQEEEVYGGLAQDPNLAAWNPQDEVFDINPELDHLDLLGDMGLPTTSKQLSLKTDSTATGITEQAHDPTLLPEYQQQMDFDVNQMPPLEDVVHPEHLRHDLSESRLEQEHRADTAEAADQDKHDQDAEVVKSKRARKKRKAAQALVDDLDNLQIRSKEYRQWVTDHSNLINHDLRRGAAALRSPSANNNTVYDPTAAILGPSHIFNFGAGPLSAAAAGVNFCPELLELFRAPVEAALSPRGDAAKADGDGMAPPSPEANNSSGAGGLPGVLQQEVHRDSLTLDRSRLDEAGEVQQDLHLLPEQEFVSNDEAHDQLMDLPFADVEIERLRAGGISSPNSGSLHLSSGGTARQLLRSSRHADSDTSNDSMLDARQYDGSEIGSLGGEGTALKRALRMSSDVNGLVEDQLGIYFGTGSLEDLLPDVQLPAEQQEINFGSGVHPSSSQFPLLEETDPEDRTHAGLPEGIVTQQSKKVIRYARFELLLRCLSLLYNGASGLQLTMAVTTC
eukprot:GHRR01010606.1.p1 GENE.GHRR01010606.1~~GHRR01010606.1.p1  ORF type:complete len:723 (+),score=258.79 GHRR01010606.1:347-2515(+)